MLNRRNLIVGGALLGLGACATTKFRTYDGPSVTSIVVYKERRRLYLMNDDEILRDFEFELGFAPVGHKQYEGDGRTPEGAYRINRRNPNSAFYLSIGISYPNNQDRAAAAALGRPPGGDIFIHGTPGAVGGNDDWTAGCIAVTDREMEDIYSMVQDGTPIFIHP
jgi:murein L,D-transpeptidase YafK